MKPSPSPPETGPRSPALLQLLRTAETIWNGSRTLFARWDLSPSQFNLLNLLRLSPDGLSQVDLGRELLMHRSNITGLVDRLEQRRLVRRRDDPGDRRSYLVMLTAEGARLVTEILPHYHAGMEEVMAGLSLKRAAALTAELREIATCAEAVAQRLSREP